MNRERLQKLAEHLMIGNLAHQKFDINHYNVAFKADDAIDWEAQAKTNHCGTTGCALGECPAVWPGLWRWEGNQVVLVGEVDPMSGDEYDGISAGAAFFNIEYHQASSLFMPSGYPHLEEVTALDVAKKIHAMLGV